MPGSDHHLPQSVDSVQQFCIYLKKPADRGGQFNLSFLHSASFHMIASAQAAKNLGRLIFMVFRLVLFPDV